ncbi:EthD family reductase [Phototrophicus methaneseepsis]|uniref:EthD family reductase n=1 Tax=Phototrophicus methaneseepsis TaxID=2710758 RepID=A0A7S8E8X5_9CHLR|nr:EthD family reductase [Phototrophicus methaneseepsis]QPC82555.1 EthD family reductase [Phototrophicus methaneseepsis]
MSKFVVMFRHPAEMHVFENIYTDFLSLVERMPDIQRRQVVHLTGSPMGETPYYRVLELYFADEAAMRQALMSPAGQEAGGELERFGPDSILIWYGDEYEDDGGSNT